MKGWKQLSDVAKPWKGKSFCATAIRFEELIKFSAILNPF